MEDYKHSSKQEQKERKTSTPPPKKEARKAKKPKVQGEEYVQQIDGSNCWAVHGNHTASGRPIVAGDPHLNNGVPSIWVFSGIELGSEYGFGSSVPGTPGIFFGRTKTASWAVTSMGGDITDIYEERVEKGRYFYEGEWFPLKERDEVINVKGGEPVTFKVRETRHGPLINEVLHVLPLTISYSGKLSLDKERAFSIQWEGN